MKKLDIAGTRFGKWTAISRVNDSDRHSKWFCRCDCGNTKTVDMNSLRNGSSRSCGCILSGILKKRNIKHGYCFRGKQAKEYGVWNSMRARCNNPKNISYLRYGARGISVCERWASSFHNFISDMGRCPEGLTLERIDNAKGYSPENCIWDTKVRQANNRRSSRIIFYDGKSKTVADWGRELGIPASTIRARLAMGWDEVKAVSWPLKKYHYRTPSEL